MLEDFALIMGCGILFVIFVVICYLGYGVVKNVYFNPNDNQTDCRICDRRTI